jgi:hypothetical protein
VDRIIRVRYTTTVGDFPSRLQFLRRGELYRVRRPPGDRKPARSFVIVSLASRSGIDADLGVACARLRRHQFLGLEQRAVCRSECVTVGSRAVNHLIERLRLEGVVGRLNEGPTIQAHRAVAANNPSVATRLPKVMTKDPHAKL